MIFTATQLGTWAICAIATGGIIARPCKLPEAIWAVAGALLLLVTGLITWRDGLRAVGKGNNVYLFLFGMMLLSETARREGLFDWLASFAVRAAMGSSIRLFTLVYAVGTVVTVLLSNDATAVVLTPAVWAATKRAKVDALPFLFVCAFVANAASFVLPISNPANLVLYGDHMPALLAWLGRFAFPSTLSIFATYVLLLVSQRSRLRVPAERDIETPVLSTGGRIAFAGIALTTLALLAISGAGMPLGLPTAVSGILILLAASIAARTSPWDAMREISWSILPLVAGLFVMVEALARSGVIGYLAKALNDAAKANDVAASGVAGAFVAVMSNLINNLPAGLIARTTLLAAHASQRVTDSLLIGVDLGPNLSITGSLATILWLAAIRREGHDVSFMQFLKVGTVVMLPALGLALSSRLIFS